MFWYRAFLLAKAMHAYRSGRWMEAVTACNEARKANVKPELPEFTAPMNALTAMAWWRLGEAEKARKALAAAKQAVDEKFRTSADLGDHWHDWLVARVLLREAQMALKEKDDAP
jgi:hypothetical protein